MSFEYICDHYGVPAAVGVEVKYTGNKIDGPRHGVITGATGSYIMVRLYPDTISFPYHPTWELEYLPDTGDTNE